MRITSALFFVLLVSGCAEEPVTIPDRDAEADRLLAHVTGDAWDTVFADAPEAAYFRFDGSLRDTVGDVPNPLPAFLSDEPPYLDASARDQYATQVLGDTTISGVSARIVEAEFVSDGRRNQPIRRVRAAVSPDDGTLLHIAVDREMTSALFDERSRLSASMASGAEGIVPDHASIVALTDVPTSEPRRSEMHWHRGE